MDIFVYTHSCPIEPYCWLGRKSAEGKVNIGAFVQSGEECFLALLL